MSQFYAYEDNDPAAAEDWGLEVLPHAGFDDRGSNARAYQGWTELLRDRPCPSIEDLEPTGVAGPGDMLIDLRSDPEDPELTCIGGALVAECGRRGLKRLSQAPGGSFLALLAAHYRYAVLARHPIAFQGERPEADGRCSTYRAILLPYSSDGETVDFVHGRISWRELADRDLSNEIRRELERAQPHAAVACSAAVWPRGPELELSSAV